jgi:hypothetical protein
MCLDHNFAKFSGPLRDWKLFSSALIIFIASLRAGAKQIDYSQFVT